MTNAEKYLKDETRAEFFEAYKEYIKKRVHLNEEEYTAGENIIETFMQLEAKPTLTEDERVILRLAREKYNTIGREKEMDLGEYDLYVTNLPYDPDYLMDYADMSVFNDLFQFIKERRRI